MWVCLPGRRSIRALSLLLLSFLVLANAGHGVESASEPDTLAAINLDQSPLAFEANRGQTDPAVAYLARAQGCTVFVTPGETVLSLCSPSSGGARTVSVLRMRCVDGNLHASTTGGEEMPGRVHYFRSSHPDRWHTDIPVYRQVRLAQIYPGIDLVYYGCGRQLEYDFVVSPGADPTHITLAFDGVEHTVLDDTGNLELQLPEGQLVVRRPVLYQEKQGARVPIEGGFALLPGNRVAFEVGPYDSALALTIDPVFGLAYSTYLGG
ncbi:MAG: hypothetical protein HY706_08785, partial [Candidatus Hydrogenedentes bacterium]|nr:hypothetical protein [Candidatus Hydrogenedentota bacterium]